jgi:hypothetical protein
MSRQLVASNGRISLAVDISWIPEGAFRDTYLVAVEALRLLRMLRKIQPGLRLLDVTWWVQPAPELP